MRRYIRYCIVTVTVTSLVTTDRYENLNECGCNDVTELITLNKNDVTVTILDWLKKRERYNCQIFKGKSNDNYVTDTIIILPATAVTVRK
jgi:hypothetical protein